MIQLRDGIINGASRVIEDILRDNVRRDKTAVCQACHFQHTGIKQQMDFKSGKVGDIVNFDRDVHGIVHLD